MNIDYLFQITETQYNYLLPIFGNIGTKQLYHTVDRKYDKYYFIGSNDNYVDMLNRCKYI